MERIGKTIIKFLTIISKIIVDFVSLKREWALHDSLSKSINLILNLSVHTLNVVILLGKNSCELWLKRAAKYKTVLVDNQLTLFTTAKISSN